MKSIMRVAEIACSDIKMPCIKVNRVSNLTDSEDISG